MDICGSDCGCGAFQHILTALNSFGVEPAIKDPFPPQPDREDKIVVFETPINWSLRQLREFNIELWDSPLAFLPSAGTPCFACYSRDYKTFRSRECESCGAAVYFCKECNMSYAQVGAFLSEDGYVFCHDCKTEDIDVDTAPSLTALTLRTIIAENGITMDDVKTKMNQSCTFDDNIDDMIESAVFECLNQRTIIHKGKMLYFNKEIVGHPHDESL